MGWISPLYIIAHSIDHILRRILIRKAQPNKALSNYYVLMTLGSRTKDLAFYLSFTRKAPFL